MQEVKTPPAAESFHAHLLSLGSQMKIRRPHHNKHIIAEAKGKNKAQLNSGYDPRFEKNVTDERLSDKICR